MRRRGFSTYLLAASAGVFATGCTRLYYSSMEKFGVEKRDILVDRIAKGRKDQEEAKEQFQSALEAFQSLTGFEGGDLEKAYKKLNSEYESSEARAKDVQDRIDSIEKVARDLFKEWQGEIDSMTNPNLKARSRQLLAETKRRYQPLIGKMKQAEKRMQPVLQVFHDQVLFLKHNLNAKAIQSLKQTAIEIDGRVANLVKDIEASIKESDDFISHMSQPS